MRPSPRPKRATPRHCATSSPTTTRDASGRDAADVRNFLHAWLVAHPSVNLLTRIDSIELEGTELARVRVTVGMLGREATGESDWDLAADVERLDLRLAREGDDWRVIRAGPAA